MVDEIDLGGILGQVRNLAIVKPMKHSVLVAGLPQNAGEKAARRAEVLGERHRRAGRSEPRVFIGDGVRIIQNSQLSSGNIRSLAIQQRGLCGSGFY